MPANQVLEVRVFRVHPGRRDELLARIHDQILPMLKRHGVEPIHWGPSLHDENSFFLIRAWPSVEERQAKLDVMYGGPEWLIDQEEAVLDMIDSTATAVLATDERLIGAIQQGFEGRAAEAALASEGESQDQRG